MPLEWISSDFMAWVMFFVITFTPLFASVSMMVCLYYIFDQGVTPPKRFIWTFVISFPLMLALLAWFTD